jgi:hypothetical protein
MTGQFGVTPEERHRMIAETAYFMAQGRGYHLHLIVETSPRRSRGWERTRVKRCRARYGGAAVAPRRSVRTRVSA